MFIVFAAFNAGMIGAFGAFVFLESGTLEEAYRAILILCIMNILTTAAYGFSYAKARR